MDQRAIEYVDAAKACAEARQAAITKIAIITAACDALRLRLPTFLAVNYNLASPGVDRGRQTEHVNLRSWPSAAELEECLRAWHAAFAAMHEAWGAVPAHERVPPVSPPPGRMSLT